MAQYTPTSGMISQIGWYGTEPNQIGCALQITFQSRDQGEIHMIVDGSTYVMDNRPLNVGDYVTFFYSSYAPAPLIYPPRYQAVAAVHTPNGINAYLDVFTQVPYNSQLTNSEDTLRLNLSGCSLMTLPNGQPFGGALAGKLLLVLYCTTTHSIPAQTTPEKIVVFCGNQVP